MSLQSREEDASDRGLNQKPRKAEAMRERYQKHSIENLIRQAEYKDTLGMELSADERFVIDNKGFLLKRRKALNERDENLR